MKISTGILLMCVALAVSCASPQQTGHGDGKNAVRHDDPINNTFGAVPAHRVPIFPRSNPPSHLVSINVSSLSYDMQLLLASLQGVTSKTEPRIDLLWSAADAFWLTRMETSYGVTSETASDPWAVFDQFAADADGVIVFDPDLPGSVNLATDLAALDNAVIASPALLSDLQARGLPVIEDLRGRFTDDLAMFEWAFENIWPDMNPAALCFLDPNLTMLRDYLIAHNIFTLMLNPHIPDERALLESILDQTPPNIPLLGWAIDELLGVMIFSEHGKFHVATDMARNLSVTSGLPSSDMTQDHAPPADSVENKTYISFAYTDGDNVAYSLDAMWSQWNDPARGQLPLGWEVSFHLLDLAPQAMGYYYETATPNDMFIAPASGVGYVYPRLYPDLNGFLDLTRPLMGAADMDTIWLINDNLALADDIVLSYAQKLALSGVFIDYWPNLDKGFYLASDGTPVLRSQYVYLVGPEQIPNVIAEKKIEKDAFYPDSPFFLFIGVNGWVTTPTIIKSIVDGLSDEYVVLRPDAMFMAMKKAGEEGYQF